MLVDGGNKRNVRYGWGLYRVWHVDGLASGVVGCIHNMGMSTFVWIQNGAVVAK